MLPVHILPSKINIGSESLRLSSSYSSSDSTFLTEVQSPRSLTSESSSFQSSENSQTMFRECPRSLWQQDSDAPACSMMLCQKSFQKSGPGAFILFLSSSHRRHHCRQCGRVVCGDCSKGARYLLPSHPSSSSRPALHRVCDACLHSTATFEFKPPDVQSPSASISRTSRTFSTFSPISRSSALVTRPLSLTNLLRRCHQNEGSACGDEADSDCCHNKVNIAVDDDETSQAETPLSGAAHGARARAGSSPVTTSIHVIKSSSPLRIPAGDRRGCSSRRELEASSYYQGLLQYEPAALRILLADALDRPVQGDIVEPA